MNDLQVFNNQQFGELRTIKLDNEPWFVAIDVCKILELLNPTMVMKRLDEDEVTKLNLGSRQGETFLVNEYGLYSLILGSRKKEAKQFKRWVTHEILPAIRKTGGYIANEENMTDDELIAKAMSVLNKKLELAHKQLEEQKPKVIFADSVSASNDTILIRDLAKILNQNGIDIGGNRLFDWLRDNGYLIKAQGRDYNSPTQKSLNMGLMKVKETSITHSSGYTTIHKTPLVSGKGQIYFINKFKALQEVSQC